MLIRRYCFVVDVLLFCLFPSFFLLRYTALHTETVITSWRPRALAARTSEIVWNKWYNVYFLSDIAVASYGIASMDYSLRHLCKIVCIDRKTLGWKQFQFTECQLTRCL